MTVVLTLEIPGYNSGSLIRSRISAVFLVACALASTAFPQERATLAHVAQDSPATANMVLLVLPFHNDSKAPGLEWIGEAFPEVLGQRMQSRSIFLISREDRLYAFDRMGIPANVQLSRATLLRIAEQMDVDYVVLGSYDYDGRSFSARSQLLDMRRLHVTPASMESGSLLQLVNIQAASAWDLLRELQPSFDVPKEQFVAETNNIRLDALENYVRGVMAASSSERIRHFKEAVRLNPNYAMAMLQLGKTYFGLRDYASAVNWFSRVPATDERSLEANFFLGLAAYYSGNLDRAEEAFRFVATRLPLTEVYNNLGVVEARRGKDRAIEYIEKAVQADPADEDYHFNLCIVLARAGDTNAAIRQLKEAVSLRPADSEAKSYLESITAGSSSSRDHVPLERIKRNYDEASFRQLAFAIQNVEEAQMAHSDPKRHASMHIERGKEQLREGFYEQARDSFREAVSLDPENSEAHLGLANAEIALNDLAGARTELDSTLRNKPSPEGYVALAQLDLKENKLDAANQDVNQALRLEPGNPAALQLRQQLASKLEAAPQTRR